MKINKLKIDLKFKIKNFKLNLFWVFLLVVGYFLTRLINLTVIPVFCDEAIYIRWAQVMRAVQSLRFLPLSDGKQPLFMWLMIPFLKIFSDPLVAGRMVSVLAGLGTMAGVYILSYLLFEKKEISLFASLLYLITPFTLFFDRMALTDGLLSMLGIWFLIFAVLLAQNLRLDLAMIGGIILGLGLITKSPALFFALMLPLCLLVKDGCHCEGFIPEAILKKATGKEIASSRHTLGLAMTLIRMTVLSGVVYLFAFAIYNILRLGPEFHLIALRNKDYVFSLNEIIKHPLNPFLGNFKDAISWFWILLTPPVFILGILGMVLMLYKNIKNSALLLIWFLVPLLAQSAVAKVFTSRYVLFSVPIFLVFCAFALLVVFKSLKNKILTTVVLTILFVFPLFQIMQLVINPQKAWLPANERSGYLERWTAGYGIRESADYLKQISKTQKVLVGTEGYFGTLPDGLQIYLEKVPNVTVIGVGYPIKEIPEKLINGLVDNRVFLLVNDTRFEVKRDEKLKLITQYPKAKNQKIDSRENLLLFEIEK